MPENKHCPKCGAPIAADAPAGLCLRCVAQLSAASPESGNETMVIPFSEKPGDRIGNYKLLEQIGEGGCGVVYVAEQEEPIRRRVALKVIKLGMDTRQVIARFEAERQALALMDHPNIAKVLDAGATDAGRPYFVMELVKGISITRYCDENRLDTQKRLGLFIQVCQAVQHAHQKGIIHRDIKPSNVLVADHDGVPIPKIIDFGIAKATTDQRLTDKTLYTAMEQFIGTPAYMSPEQARLSGLDLDTRSDIYSLGVLLYELLTGKTPFDARRLVQAGLDEIRRIIREEDPPRPSARLSTLSADEQTTLAKQRHSEPPKLLYSIRGDLDWIVMKTLEKDRNRRYETANGLALDIERHLRSEPVTARPASQLYRLQRLVRRNKLAFAAIGAVTASLLIGLAVSTSLFFKEKEARRGQVQLRQQAQNEAQRAKAAELKAMNTLSSSDFEQAVHLISEDSAREALAYLKESLSANPTNDAAAVRLATLLTYRSWMGSSEVFKHNGPAESVQFSPDCKRLLTLSEDNSVRVWDAKTDQPLTPPMNHKRKLRSAQFSPDSRKILTVSDENALAIWDTGTGRPLTEFPTNNGKILLAQFSPNAETVVTVSDDKTVRVWNVESGQAMTEPLKADVATDLLTQDTVTFSPDGERLLTISDEVHGPVVGYRNTTKGTESLEYVHRGTSGTRARVWDVRTGLRLTIPLENGKFVTSGRFSPNAERLVTISFGKNEAHLWVLENVAANKFPMGPSGLHVVGGDDSGKPILSKTIQEVSTARLSSDGSQIVVDPEGLAVEKISKEAPKQPGDAALSHNGQVVSVRFSPDGSKIVTASEDKTARVWDGYTGNPLSRPMRHHDMVYLAEFSPDGQRIVTAAKDHTVRVWDAQTGEPLTEPIILSENAVSAQFTPDGRQVAAISPGDTLRIWSEHLPGTELLTQRDRVRAARFSGNGKRIVTLSWNDRVRVWDAESGQALTDSLEHPAQVCSTQLSPDGTRIVTALKNKTARLDDALTGKPLTEPLGHGDVVQSARFSRDGLKLVTASWDNTARVWDAQTGRPLTQSLQHPAGVMSAEFSSDGTRIVTICSNNTAWIWDAGSGRPVLAPIKHKARIWSAEFNPDGNRILTCSEDGTARVWDARTGQPLTDPLIHAGKLIAAHFSPNERRIITAAEDNAVRLWDAQTGKLIKGPLWCGGTIGSVEFSPDSKRFLTASEGAGARIWDAQTGQLLTDLFLRSQDVNYAQFSPDGKRILTAAFDIFEYGHALRRANPNPEEGTSNKVARIYDIAPPKGTCPPWVLQIAEAICGQRLSDEGILEPLNRTPAETFKQVREQLSREAGEDDWTVWGRWFLADPSTRTVSPFFKVTVPEYVENLIKQNTVESLAEADELAFGNARLQEEVAKARKTLSPPK